MHSKQNVRPALCHSLRLACLMAAALLLGGMSLTHAANPIISTAYSADPSAHVFGGRIYVYPSHDRNDAQQYDMTDYHVYSTDDMANWQDHGVVLSLAQVPWAKAHLWAPDCNVRNGTYYLYFPADTTGNYNFRIGVATSKSPAGPFVAEPNPIAGVSGSDPSIFMDDDGTPYLIWAGAGPQICKLKPDMKTLDGAPTRLQGCDKFFEGPWLFKRQGLYYLTYPAFQPGGSGLGGNGQNYDYAVSSNILGPYTYKGTFAKSGPGAGNIHGSQVAWHGQWYCFYHDCFFSQGDPKEGFKRSVRADLMTFAADGTIQPLQTTLTGPPPIKNADPSVRRSAVCLSQTAGPQNALSVYTEPCAEGGQDLGFIKNGSWVRYAGLDFGRGMSSFSARVAMPTTGKRTIELHLDSLDGPLLGTCFVPLTGGYQTWRTASCPVKAVRGVHNLFLKFGGEGGGYLFNLAAFRFARASAQSRR